MSDYTTLNKTNWFIEKMTTKSFSRKEIIEFATNEFPDISRTKLEGTIGQYWSDCLNPKWATWKIINARGLRVEEIKGRRRIVKNESPLLHSVSDREISIKTLKKSAADNYQHRSKMSDPLAQFNWSELYNLYDQYCSNRFTSNSTHLKAIQPQPISDRSLYRHLVQAAPPDDSGTRSGVHIGWYEALLYWKLYSQRWCKNIASWLPKDQSAQKFNSQRLCLLLSEMPGTIPQDVAVIMALLKGMNKYALSGMKTETALPVRTTFLHMLYPTVVPILDTMVLQAVGITDTDANHNLNVFAEYLVHVWELKERYVSLLTGFSETTVRLIDMAL